MIDLKYDTQVSVYEVKIESIFKNIPINFVQKEKTPPSQFLEPVKAYACGIMGWKSENFKKNIAYINKRSCKTCHLVHQPAAAIQQTWRQKN